MAKIQNYYRPDKGGDTKRGHYRAKVDIDGFYRLGREWIPCKIYDLSLGGAGLKLNQFFVEGDQIELKVGQSEEAVVVMGTVANVNGQRIGLSFSLESEVYRKLSLIIDKAAARHKPGHHVKFEI